MKYTRWQFSHTHSKHIITVLKCVFHKYRPGPEKFDLLLPQPPFSLFSIRSPSRVRNESIRKARATYTRIKEGLDWRPTHGKALLTSPRWRSVILCAIYMYFSRVMSQNYFGVVIYWEIFSLWSPSTVSFLPIWISNERVMWLGFLTGSFVLEDDLWSVWREFIQYCHSQWAEWSAIWNLSGISSSFAHIMINYSVATVNLFIPYGIELYGSQLMNKTI